MQTSTPPSTHPDINQCIGTFPVDNDVQEGKVPNLTAFARKNSHYIGNVSQDLTLPVDESTSDLGTSDISLAVNYGWKSVGKGIMADISRRLPHYWSDYTDGLRDLRSVQKTISTTAFLYFACLLPTIAFGSLNSTATNGVLNARKGILAQAIGQFLWSILSGQHLSIILTTAPLCLFVKIIYSMAEYFELVAQFGAIYLCVGLWSSFFLVIAAVCNISSVMQYCTRSTEEIFALFISIAFVFYATRDVVQDFSENYSSHNCRSDGNISFINLSGGINSSIENSGGHESAGGQCHRDTSLLFLLLCLGTFLFGMMLHNFKNARFFNAAIREVMSDYALPIAVLSLSFVGSFLFAEVAVTQFDVDLTTPLFQLADVSQISWPIILASAPTGFCLAILIFMDQNIGATIVNSSSNRLKKGSAYHYDLIVIAAINTFCSIFNLPWLHVALPHAPLHVKNLAEFEEILSDGNIVPKVLFVRETRLPGIISHIMIGLSLLMFPTPLSYIPKSVFAGFYLFMGITALEGNSLWERTLALFSDPPEQSAKIPRRASLTFTVIQLAQLGVLCFLGFYPFPFLEVLFPIVLLLLLVVRQKLLPHVLQHEYLNLLD